ncbi:MAG: helix-turn-helix transcriptional regulator [Cellvibrionaceae bacterium]
MKNNSVPSVFIWRDSTLLIGTSHRPTRSYTVASDQLIVCLKGEVTTTRSDGSQFSGKVFLIRAGTVINMPSLNHDNDAVMAILYMSPANQTYSALKEQMLNQNDNVYYNLPNEDELITLLNRIHKENLPAKETYDLVHNLLIPEELREKVLKEFDSRVLKVIARINSTAKDNIPINKLAEEVHLSESRLVKLFKSQIGIPITKYRLQYRISVGSLYLATGHSVTESALMSGFASTAHFSKSYSAMMGIQPSTAFMRSGLLNIKIAEEILALLPNKTVLHSEALNGDDQ